MAYEGASDWQQILTPFLQGIGGSLVSSFDDLPWLEDELALDPFQTDFDAEVRRLVGDTAPRSISVRQREGFTLPTAATRGDAAADFIAASKGVDPSSKTRGVGNMLDLAKTMVGVPYVFGAIDPGTAFDCSGFTKWLYSRSLGVALPHLSTDQAKSLDKLGRDELQPGDLVFFSYGRLGPGVIDHVEVYMGNGKMIGTANQNEDLDIDQVDWEHFVQGGRAPGVADAGVAKATRGKAKQGVVQQPIEHQQSLAPLALAGGPPAFAAVMDAIFAPDSVPVVTEKAPSFRGSNKAIQRDLYRGFIDAGRPDLARMVGTKEFNTWVRAESGWNPSVTSQYFEGHGVNYGLFQFWEGHKWTEQYVQGGKFTATPYEQAKLVAKYFGHLTPARIREYAAQIANGTYKGWG